jgi:hypothetical protein
MSPVSVVCCQVEASASGWSLIQMSPAKCGMSECDSQASIMWRPSHLLGAVAALGRKKKKSIIVFSSKCC